MPNFKRGKIYRVKSLLKHRSYVGSTCRSILARWTNHRSDAKRLWDKHNVSLWKAMHKHGADKFKIVLLENYPCDNRKQLRKREQWWINKLKPYYNDKSAYISTKDKAQKYRDLARTYYKEHRGAKLKQMRKYMENHRKEYKEWQLQYYKKNINKIRDYGDFYRENRVRCKCGQLTINLEKHELSHLHKRRMKVNIIELLKINK